MVKDIKRLCAFCGHLLQPSPGNEFMFPFGNLMPGYVVDMEDYVCVNINCPTNRPDNLPANVKVKPGFYPTGPAPEYYPGGTP